MSNMRVLVSGCMLLVASCVVGAENDPSVVDAVDQEATNRPYKNGCEPNVSVLACARLKGVDASWACGFQKRKPGVIFKLVVRGTTNNLDWVAENLVPRLPAESTGYFLKTDTKYVTRGNWPLTDFCEYYNPMASTWDITMIPTAAGCKKLAGRWDGKYCY